MNNIFQKNQVFSKQISFKYSKNESEIIFNDLIQPLSSKRWSASDLRDRGKRERALPRFELDREVRSASRSRLMGELKWKKSFLFKV